MECTFNVMDSAVVKTCCFAVFIVFALFQVGRPNEMGKTLKISILCLSLLFILSFKWFAVSCNIMLNGDEAFVFANALTLVYVDPLPYKIVEFGTLGPVHAFFFIVPQFFDLPVSFASLRVVWLVVWFLAQVLIFMSLANFFKRSGFYYAFLYSFLLAATSQIYDFNFFNNESTSLLLLATGLYFLSRNFEVERHSNHFDYLSVFVLSIAPFAKLHAGLLALAIVGFVLIQKLKSASAINLKYALSFVISGLAFPVAFSIYLALIGQFGSFWFFYIDTNLQYGSTAPLWERFFNTFIVRSTSEYFLNYYVKHLYLILVLANCILVFVKRFEFRTLLFSVCGLVSVLSISLPGNYYGHYFSYLLLTFGLGISTIGYMAQSFSRSVFILWKSVVLALSMSFAFFAIKGHAEAYSGKSCNEEKSGLAKALMKIGRDRKLAKPRMAIFDWRNEVYIETGFWPATHYSMPERLLGNQAKSLEVVYKAREIYLRDLKRERPEFFVLGTSTKYSYWDMTETTLRKLPRIHAYVLANYSLVEEVDDAKIYLRKDSL